MKSGFLEAKIQKPRVSPNLIYRERLIKRLQDKEKQLVVLHATVGYGKTVLLAQYADHTEENCAWYHLSETDNDSVLFLQYICAAIQKSLPAFNFAFQARSSLFQGEDALETVICDFISHLTTALHQTKTGLVIMLDDFQTIHNEKIFHILRMILDNAGENLRVMLATKGSIPPFCLRYFLQGATEIIAQKDLAFRQEEAWSFFALLGGEEACSGLVETIWQRTEGWPAGMMFAHLYLKQQRQWPASGEQVLGCQKAALDTYFMHELYKKLSYEMQTFLVRTASLEFLSAELCNAVLQIDNAHSILDYLERENLFISKVGQGDRLFRYHSLFKDFLNSMSNKETEGEILTRAAEFYLCTSDKASAVEYALAGGNWDLMQYALEHIGQDLLEQGKITTLARWVAELEENRIAITPKNMLWVSGYFYRTGQTEQAVTYLNQALTLFLSSMDETGYICGTLEKARIARNQASLEESNGLIEKILPRLDARYNRLWYTVTVERLYNFILLGRYREALAICSEMILNTRQAGNQKAEGMFMRFSTVIYFYMGKYQKGLKLYNDLLEFNWITRDEDDIFSVEAYVALMYLFTGQKKKARETIREELERTAQRSKREDLWLIYLIQAYIQFSVAAGEENDLLQKRHLLQEAEQSILMAERHVAFFKQNFAYLKSVQIVQELIRVALYPESAVVSSARIFQAEKKALPLARSMALSSLAGLLYERGDGEQAQRVASCCLETKEWPDAFTFQAQVILALAHDKCDQQEKTADQLGELEKYDWNRQGDEDAQNPEKSSDSRNRGDCQLSWGFLPLRQRQRLETLLQKPEDSESAGKIEISCLGDFKVRLPGEKEEVQWRTKKAQELFAYLFHLQGQPVDKEQILLQLWPDTDKKSATSLLHTTLYSIRKMLASCHLEELIVYDKKKYAMKMNVITSDLEPFQQLCQGLGQWDETFVHSRREVLKEYKGDYLGGISCDFASGPRAYYEKKFLQLSDIVARQCLKKKQWEEGVACLEKAIAVDSYEEKLYVLIMECFSHLKEVKRAKKYYEQLADIMRNELEIEPSPEVVEAYRSCLESGLGKRKVAVG